ncbi:hypothetical protein BS50DRAFT_568939 [Corynespora cassiicola Philippines]|uniref:Uncharacterized protein n=1 Tax=Corynespora cassiicola Philippines TaxID=1448308 RepID=A0A2T2P6T3_CORCC|nr:hypothetical protein BS50DRAFT_568939 [Corynespora cassiicola Philippines]
MPSLPGFSDNSFSSHADFKAACIALLRALKPYQSPGGARIRLPLATGTHFDDVAAQLEGYARPLWAVASLIHGGSLTSEEYQELAEPYVRGLANGTDPSHPEYWGPVVLRDQRMVEMEIISYALLVAPDSMFHNQTVQAQANIKTWLNTLNGKDFPTTNWLWFRVMTNLALVSVCGVPHDELRGAMDDDLDQMEQFYLSEGWAADGIWNEHGRQADYYSGSFAIQFSQLLYAKLASDLDPKRCERFRARAKDFAKSFWRYFDENGAAIPFGRSLTYRFAFAGFWSAAAFAGVGLTAPVEDLGTSKGLLLRHFRWWSSRSDIFNVDGTLTIGFAYPNMYMSEDYNSPQSPYWAMKSFVAIGLPDTDPFWTTKERPLPTNGPHQTTVLEPPMHIICKTENHHFLLSTGQFCPWPLKATEAKYGKYAYSSHFGFSVPTGPLMAQMAPDSTLALSKDGGDTWRVPWKVLSYGIGSVSLTGSSEGDDEILPTLSSVWKPWKDADIQVSTTLVAPSQRWPDWHVRVHKIKNDEPSSKRLSAVEGGFAIYGRGSRFGEALTLTTDDSELLFGGSDNNSILECALQTELSALVCSKAGASGIVSLDASHQFEKHQGQALKPDANTSIIWQRSLIPTIQFDDQEIKSGESIVLISGIFAMGIFGVPGHIVKKHWQDPPRIRVKGWCQNLAEREAIEIVI